jgi:hypothetical protein
LWAIDDSENSVGPRSIQVAFGVLAENEADTLGHVTMETKDFLRLIPESCLSSVPDDPSGLDLLGTARREKSAAERMIDYMADFPLTSEEGRRLSDQWGKGKRPVEATLMFLLQARPWIAYPLVDWYLEALESLPTRGSRAQPIPDMAELCLAISLLLEWEP